MFFRGCFHCGQVRTVLTRACTSAVIALSCLTGFAEGQTPSVTPTARPTETPVWYLGRIQNSEEYDLLSVPDTTYPELGMERITKFTCPVRDAAGLVPTVYQNVNIFPFHLIFAKTAFPEVFGGLTASQYWDITLGRANRQYYIGSLLRLRGDDGTVRYGIHIDTYKTAGELLSIGEVQVVYRFLSQTSDLGTLVYSPLDPLSIREARNWVAPPFPVVLPEGISFPVYEAYNEGTNYGRVQALTLGEFEQRAQSGEISWQDIIAVDAVPFDLEIIVAGILTGGRQTELSHVNLRAARRGTPNAYVEQAHLALARYQGQLVRLDVQSATFSITPNIPIEQAEAWWARHRPILRRAVYPDLEAREIVALSDMPMLASPGLLATRYGGKAANLAVLYRTLDPQYQVAGAAIPFAYYRDFVRQNWILDTSQSPPRQVTYEAYLASLWEDPRVRADPGLRRQRLEAFQNYAQTYGYVSPALVQTLAARIETIWGSPRTMVRFRSSSNLEDDLGFSAAGLYESVSVCAEDSLDGDTQGPSHCNAAERNERTIERGLRRVWTSLWSPRAWEERDWYQVDQSLAAMAILITTAFPDEKANGVAFTGDPDGTSDHYVINANPGDYSVVRPDPAFQPELDLLPRQGCSIGRVIRVRGSSLLPAGEWVLTDEQLATLGQVLCSTVEATFPVDTQEFSREQVRLDVEFKITQADQLILKQIRPFLVTSAPLPGDETFHSLVVPVDQTLASVYLPGRSVRDEHRLAMRLVLNAGTFWLSRVLSQHECDLVQRVEVGPSAARAEPITRGVFSRELVRADEEQRWTYRFAQSFLVNGLPLSVTAEGLVYTLPSGATQAPAIMLDDGFALGPLRARAFLNGEVIPLSSETFAPVPLSLVRVVCARNRRIDLYLRVGGQDIARLARATLLLWPELRHVERFEHLSVASPEPGELACLVRLDPPHGTTHGVEVVLQPDSSANAYLLTADLERVQEIDVEAVEHYSNLNSALWLR